MATTFAPGIRLVVPIHSAIIDCPDRRNQCAWGYSHRSFGPGNIDGYFWHKFVNIGCRLHSKMAHSSIPETVRYGPAFRVTKDGRRRYN